MEFYLIGHTILAMNLFSVPSPEPEIAAAENVAAIVPQR
jgi:hypothetical protein